MPGPKNGVNTKHIAGIARLAGLHTSLIVPAAIANIGAKQNPARNRNTQIPAKVLLSPTPKVNKLPNTIEPMYTGYRPMVSDRGPPTTGPRARANT